MDDFYSSGRPSGKSDNDDFFAGGPSGSTASPAFYDSGSAGEGARVFFPPGPHVVGDSVWRGSCGQPWWQQPL